MTRAVEEGQGGRGGTGVILFVSLLSISYKNWHVTHPSLLLNLNFRGYEMSIAFHNKISALPKKFKFSIKDFFSKFDHICSFLWIWSHWNVAFKKVCISHVSIVKGYNSLDRSEILLDFVNFENKTRRITQWVFATAVFPSTFWQDWHFLWRLELVSLNIF